MPPKATQAARAGRGPFGTTSAAVLQPALRFCCRLSLHACLYSPSRASLQCLRSLDLSRRDSRTIGKGARCLSSCFFCMRVFALALLLTGARARVCVYSFVAGMFVRSIDLIAAPLTGRSGTTRCLPDCRGRSVVFALAPVVRDPADTRADDSAPSPDVCTRVCVYAAVTLLSSIACQCGFLRSMSR